MEINDLKSVWKKARDQEKPGYWVSQEDVQQMIHHKSKLTIQGVKRAMRWKLFFFTTSAILALLATVLYKSGSMDEEGLWLEQWLTVDQIGDMLVFMFIIVALVVVLSVQRYRKVVWLEKSSLPLSESLKKVRSIIRGVINIGIYGDVIGIPILVIWGMSIYYYGKTGFQIDIRLLHILLPAMVLSVLIYFKNSRFMQKRYGHFIVTINESLGELEATELKGNLEEV